MQCIYPARKVAVSSPAHALVECLDGLGDEKREEEDDERAAVQAVVRLRADVHDSGRWPWQRALFVTAQLVREGKTQVAYCGGDEGCGFLEDVAPCAERVVYFTIMQHEMTG